MTPLKMLCQHDTFEKCPGNTMKFETGVGCTLSVLIAPKCSLNTLKSVIVTLQYYSSVSSEHCSVHVTPWCDNSMHHD